MTTDLSTQDIEAMLAQVGSARDFRDMRDSLLAAKHEIQAKDARIAKLMGQLAEARTQNATLTAHNKALEEQIQIVLAGVQ